MKKIIKILIILAAIFPSRTSAQEYLYILNDECINILYNMAKEEFKNSSIISYKDPRGVILRINLDENNKISESNIKRIEYFLAKIENPAIIEVHIEKFSNSYSKRLKKWEISTIIANEFETLITKPVGLIKQSRINSIGYGEFLPVKNTSNNGGKIINRVDIIILCNISGE